MRASDTGQGLWLPAYRSSVRLQPIDFASQALEWNSSSSGELFQPPGNAPHRRGGGDSGRAAEIIGRAARIGRAERRKQLSACEAVVNEQRPADRHSQPLLGKSQRFLLPLDRHCVTRDERRQPTRTAPFLPLLRRARVDDEPGATKRRMRVLTVLYSEIAGRA